MGDFSDIIDIELSNTISPLAPENSSNRLENPTSSTQIRNRGTNGEHKEHIVTFTFESAIKRNSTMLMIVSLIITVLGEISYIVFVGSETYEIVVTFFIYLTFMYNFYENTRFADEIIDDSAEFLIQNDFLLKLYASFLFALCFLTADYAFGVKSTIITLCCRFSMLFIVVIITVLQHKTLSFIKAFTYNCKFHKIDIFKNEKRFITEEYKLQMINNILLKKEYFIKTRRFLRISLILNGISFIGLVSLCLIHLDDGIQNLKYIFFLMISVLSTILMAMIQVVYYNQVLDAIRIDLNAKPLLVCSLFGWKPNVSFLLGCLGAFIITLIRILVLTMLNIEG